MDPLAAEALRARRASERAREGRVKRVAAQVASQATSVRGKLFDADEWLKVHSVRQERIETTFTRLYKPTGRSYWIEPKPKPPVKPLPGSQMLPAYVNDLPRALSLSHPATHEEEEGEETELELAEEVVESKPREEPFDPMAGPMEFYRNFKSRLSALRESAAAPPPTRTQIRVRPVPSVCTFRRSLSHTRGCKCLQAPVAQKAVEPVRAPSPPAEEVRIVAPSWLLRRQIVAILWLHRRQLMAAS